MVTTQNRKHLLSESDEGKSLIHMKVPSSCSVSILGSGVVGENIGRGLIEMGHKIVFYDVDREKIGKLEAAGFKASCNLEQTIEDSTISYLCVPTPAKATGEIDLSYIKDIARRTAKGLKKKGYHLVAVKSTVLPTTIEKTVIPILERHSGKKAGRDFGVCCNPEFLTEIHNSWTADESFVRGFFSEPFIVIGAIDDKSGDTLEAVYDSLESPIIRTDLKTAEMLKYAFNCALATRISYWNEVFLICRKLGIDSDIIASTAAKDPRIGMYGTIHKKAFGGKCLPKDLSALVNFCKKNHQSPRLLEAVLKTNSEIAREFGMRE